MHVTADLNNTRRNAIWIYQPSISEPKKRKRQSIEEFQKRRHVTKVRSKRNIRLFHFALVRGNIRGYTSYEQDRIKLPISSEILCHGLRCSITWNRITERYRKHVPEICTI